MNTIECLTAIFVGLIIWYLSLWTKEKYDSEWRFSILFILGLMFTFYGFSELIHFKELNSIEQVFAIAMGVLYFIIVLYAISSYLEKRTENKKKLQKRIDDIELSRRRVEKL